MLGGTACRGLAREHRLIGGPFGDDHRIDRGDETLLDAALW
jgi:hypothetical protein